jgi:hypothetical protein
MAYEQRGGRDYGGQEGGGGRDGGGPEGVFIRGRGRREFYFGVWTRKPKILAPGVNLTLNLNSKWSSDVAREYGWAALAGGLTPSWVLG